MCTACLFTVILKSLPSNYFFYMDNTPIFIALIGLVIIGAVAYITLMEPKEGVQVEVGGGILGE